MGRATLPVAALFVVSASMLGMSGAAWASTWIIRVASASLGELQASSLASAPTGAAAACNAQTIAKTIKVTGNAFAHASTYSL